jgi:hypothetical protein
MIGFNIIAARRIVPSLFHHQGSPDDFWVHVIILATLLFIFILILLWIGYFDKE